jgi:putative FmdB family regulatory protein
MPLYDWQCPSCGWEDERFAKADASLSCPTCEATAVKVWKSKASNTISDERIGGVSCTNGLTIENVGHEPQTFYSRSEYNRYLTENYIRPAVRHAPGKESDRSQHTTRWVGAPTISEEERIEHFWRTEAEEFGTKREQFQ